MGSWIRPTSSTKAHANPTALGSTNGSRAQRTATEVPGTTGVEGAGAGGGNQGFSIRRRSDVHSHTVKTLSSPPTGSYPVKGDD